MRKVLIVTGLLFAFNASAELYIYPKDGQSSQQQHQDESECKSWALDRSGYDPMEVISAGAAPQKKKGNAIRGALAGAAVGAIVGNSDDAAKGAAIGGVFGRMRQSSQGRKQSDQYEQNRQAAENAQYQRADDYARAYTVCLEARNYTVK